VYECSEMTRKIIDNLHHFALFAHQGNKENN
jgi:hypothetical protein